MDMIANVCLAAGAFGAALYCHVLNRRLRDFARLDSGMGGAIAVLSAQVDDMTQVLHAARATAGDSADALDARIARAEAAAQRLELLLASLHDLPTKDAA